MKSLLPIGCLFAASVVQAQSNVAIYGIIDAAVGVSASGNGAGSIKRVDSGVGPASRLGFRGREDLGGGLRAEFVLEQGIGIDVGALQPGGLGFGRQSWAGFGTKDWFVSAGRQYSQMDEAFARSSAAVFFYWGSPIGVGFGGNASPKATPSSGGFQATDRISNSVKLAFGGQNLGGSVYVGAGDEAPSGSGHIWGGGVYYSEGAFRVDVAYNRYRQYAADIPANAGPAWAFDGFVGASYDFGAVKVNAAYYLANPSEANTVLVAATTLKTKAMWIGARVPVGSSTFIAQVINAQYDHIAGVTQGKATTLQLAYEYSLSKQTTLYASFGQVANNATGNQVLTAGSNAVAATGFGADPKAASVGITKRF